jgi:gamma-glutamylcyclotransferase
LERLMMTTSTINQTIYFGYGSNLWLHQMTLRCPESVFLGIGKIPSYNWIINDRGYANIVEVSSSSTISSQDITPTEVWGLIFRLSSSDERNLDENEGVPFVYTKEKIKADFWPALSEGNTDTPIDVRKDPQEASMMVYIDRKRVTESQPKTEYIYRMNMGISDALRLGIPKTYIDNVLRKFIPEQDGNEDWRHKQQALEQASCFREQE